MSLLLMIPQEVSLGQCILSLPCSLNNVLLLIITYLIKTLGY